MDEHRVLREVQPHIIVATPGRAADHLRKQNFSGGLIRTLIIDEFDKSLELGFQDDPIKTSMFIHSGYSSSSYAVPCREDLFLS